MERNPYMVRDCLVALRSALLKHEMNGIFLSAKDVRELNDYLRRLAGYNHVLGHELLRYRWQIKAGCAPASGEVVPFRRFQEKKEEDHGESTN
ncbi:hypothetical protein [Bartonella rattimassiliensis]|uniref:Uncharacterized protein n=1 Tax=Bartonella rattimassiliensis 15908 TaxID=1094556 RepID=J1JRV6_9HYPH|nr:hypothetical protein [Bartonella rattimassiliensis]EJF87160.1 hypothetical protein MCY_00284 [Bartonella rattimassiliensis 15908]